MSMSRVVARWIGGLVACLCVGLLGCASTSAHKDAEGNDTTSGAVSSDPESEEERLGRLAKKKNEQCESLGNALQGSELGGREIVNLNDSGKLEGVAKEHTAAADRVAAVSVDVPELSKIRDDYVKLEHDLATSLRVTVDTKKAPEKKAALARYHELDRGSIDVIARFNEACGGGASEEAAPAASGSAAPAGK